MRNLNNYSLAQLIFDNTLEWAANNNPDKTKEQFCAEIEKILTFVEDRDNFYKKGYEQGYRDGYSERDNKCCGSGS